MRFYIALLVAKLARIASRISGRGKGTSLPGLLALKIDSNFIKRFSNSFSEGIILIAGTNGKTTTARIVGSMLRVSDRTFIANPSSSNLTSGVATAIARAANWRGKINAQYGLFEVDENALSKVANMLPPTHLVFTNLFRDQLDRYGEIEKIASRWLQTIETIPRNSTLLVNANDARLVFIAKKHRGQVKFFGALDSKIIGEPNLVAADTTRCPSCRGTLEGQRFMAHLGVLSCSVCRMQTPKPHVLLKKYSAGALSDTRVFIDGQNQSYDLKTNLIGRFNAFNIAAAVTVGEELKLSKDIIVKGTQSTSQVFGRSEHFKANSINVYLHLAKNPTGYNEVLATLKAQGQDLNLLLALNDNWADGQDISWIWDVNFEENVSKINSLIVSGQRAGDIGVRLKLAGFEKEIIVEADLNKAFSLAIQDKNNSKKNLHIIASYTAMIFLRKHLARIGLVKGEWESK